MKCMTQFVKTRRWKSFLAIFLALAVLLSMAGCTKGKLEVGTEDDDRSELTEPVAQSPANYFVWSKHDDTVIVGLTNRGKKAKEIIVPARCQTLTGSGFTENATLEKISFANPDTNFDQDFQGFIQCENLDEIVFPAHMSVIPSYCCADCIRLTKVVWPETVVEIEEDAFYSCESLRGVQIPDTVTSIGSYAFKDCRYLSELKLSNNLKSIGAEAFADCVSLYKVQLPASLKFIGADAFVDTPYVAALTDEDLARLYPDVIGWED